MMDFLIHFFTGLSPMMQGLVGALFTWFITALGASMVFFIKDVRRANMDVLMGFTGGVMLAASFWSLLNPAIGMAENQGYGNLAWLPVGIGFLAGAWLSLNKTFIDVNCAVGLDSFAVALSAIAFMLMLLTIKSISHHCAKQLFELNEKREK